MRQILYCRRIHRHLQERPWKVWRGYPRQWWMPLRWAAAESSSCPSSSPPQFLLSQLKRKSEGKCKAHNLLQKQGINNPVLFPLNLPSVQSNQPCRCLRRNSSKSTELGCSSSTQQSVRTDWKLSWRQEALPTPIENWRLYVFQNALYWK